MGFKTDNLEVTENASGQAFGMVKRNSNGMLDYSGKTYGKMYNPLSLSVGTDPFAIVYCPVNNSMYVVNRNGNSISVISCTTNEVIDTISLSVPGCMQYCPINNSMYVAREQPNSLRRIDCNTNTVEDEILLTYKPYTLYYSVSNNSIYTLNISDYTIYEVSCASNTLTNTSTTTIAHYMSRYSQDTNTIYLLNNAIITTYDCTAHTEGSTPLTLTYPNSTLIDITDTIISPLTGDLLCFGYAILSGSTAQYCTWVIDLATMQQIQIVDSTVQVYNSTYNSNTSFLTINGYGKFEGLTFRGHTTFNLHSLEFTNSIMLVETNAIKAHAHCPTNGYIYASNETTDNVDIIVEL